MKYGYRHYHITVLIKHEINSAINKSMYNSYNQLSITLDNRNKCIVMECKQCKTTFSKQFKEILKSYNDFCSHSCSASYNNRGRKMSEETKEKIRKKLQIIKYTNCKICKIEFSYRKRKNLTCGDKCLSDLKKLNNKKKRGLIIEEY